MRSLGRHSLPSSRSSRLPVPALAMAASAALASCGVTELYVGFLRIDHVLVGHELEQLDAGASVRLVSDASDVTVTLRSFELLE